MRLNLRRVSGPRQEVLTLVEAKDHLRVDLDQTADDELIEQLIEAARGDCEDYSGRTYVASNWELRLAAFPECIDLPRPPVISVLAINYYDPDGVLQTFGSDNYKLVADDYCARVHLRDGKSWPQTLNEEAAIVVEYLAGYPPLEAGSPTDYAANVPAAIKAAVKLTLGHLYRNRENSVIGTIASELPGGAKSLLAKTRVYSFP